MNAQGLFSIGGIASGLDTDDIITQLMQLERQPIARMQQRQQTLASTRDAWGQVNTKLSTLRSAVDAIRRPDRFTNLTSVTSSAPDAVSVTRSGRPTDGEQLSFTVEQLATRMQQSAGDTFTGRDALLDGRQLSVTVGGETVDLTEDLGDDATLADLIAAVNTADLGVRASALQVSEGQFRLVLTADDTGSLGAFSVDSGGWAEGFEVTQQAHDAMVRVGGIEVTRSSNTIDDLVDGVSITLHRTTDTAVTVGASRDVEAAVNAVKSFVDAANSALGTISKLTSYDAETGTAGALQGQFAATRLAAQIRSTISAPVQGLTGADATASAVGIRTARDGTLELDEARLREAFTNDFDATARRFSRAAAADSDAVSSASGRSDTQAGTYQVEVTRAAEVARVTGATYLPPGGGQPKAFMVLAPSGKMVTVRIDTDATTSTQAAAAIQDALAEAGVTNLTASTDGDRLVLETTGYGSDASFTVQELEVDEHGEIVLDAEGNPVVDEAGTAFGLAGTHEGVDALGTINGEEVVGRGRVLEATQGPAAGLSVTVNGLPDEPFNVSFWHGIGGALDQQLARAEGSGGSIARARASLESQSRIFQTRIDAFEDRLASREVTLRRQFVALETSISQFNAQSQWLDGQISQLNAMSAQRSTRR